MATAMIPWCVVARDVPAGQSVARAADELEQRAHRELKAKHGDSFVYTKVRLEDLGEGPRGYVCAKHKL